MIQLINIALRFAAEGREGKPIGTIFVTAPLEQISPYLRQLIHNPCEGHPRRTRNIFNPNYLETLREFAALDGAFVITKKGVVESAATYLGASDKRARPRPGLGARHGAAAAITAETDAVAVVLSESSRNVTVYYKGQAMLDLESTGEIEP